MDNKTRYFVGIDVGTKTVRAVQGKTTKDGAVTVLGCAEVPSEGLRRGSVVEVELPSRAISKCLSKLAEKTGIAESEYFVGLNGASIATVESAGMIQICNDDEKVLQSDVARLYDVAQSGKVPDTRVVLELVPFEFAIDGQSGIHNPVGMTGRRLEVRANVISALKPDYNKLEDVCKSLNISYYVEPNLIAASEAILTRSQKENGVAVVDFGASTVGVAIYADGELHHVAVVPLGSNDITNDLAKTLYTIPEVAEEIKVRYANCKFGESDKDIEVRDSSGKVHNFKRKMVDEIIDARLEEIFDGIRAVIVNAGYDHHLPEGVILIGGGSKIRNIEDYACEKLEAAARIGMPRGFIDNDIEVIKPEWATALGLLRMAAKDFDHPEEDDEPSNKKRKKNKNKNKDKDGGAQGIFSRILNSFKR